MGILIPRGVKVVIPPFVLISVLPLDVHGRLWVIRSMFIPGAVHGIEASLLPVGSLLKLRSSILRVIWSRRQPLANVGALLSLLDGLQGCLALGSIGTHISLVGFALGCQFLSDLADPIEYFKCAILDAGGTRFLQTSVFGKGLEVVRFGKETS